MMYLFSLSDVKKAAKEAIINAWRFLNGQLDAIAYKLLSSIYDFFKQLSEIYLYNEEIMKVIGQRIGIILGIFILFRLAVSIISYIINPDKIADSSKGTKKIITNIFLSLTLLATVNIIFKEAYLIQKKVVSSQVIEKIFFGNSSNVEKIDISFYLYSAFLQIDIQGCEPNEIYNTETAISDNCDAAIVNAGSSISDLITKEIMKKRNLRPVLAKFDNINATYKGEYVFEYTPIISLVCAVIAILILLSSCLDIATRTIKLLFLQIIAPVPIALNMAPGKGEETFKKWYKECINTYLSLFIRIAVISFAIFMISLMRTHFSSIFEGRNTLIQILLILGCLMFAKQMPKLLENIFGIKMEGMVLNPIKKFQNEALLGKQITGLGRGVAAGTIGMATGALGAGMASANLGNKWWETVGATVRGAGRGVFGGLTAGYKSKNALDAVSAGIGRYGTNADYVKSLDETSFSGRVAAGFQQKFHLKTAYDKTKEKLDKVTEFDSSIDSMLKRAEAESIKHNDLAITDSSGHSLTMAQHKQEQEKLNRLRNENLSFEEFTKSRGINTDKMNFQEFSRSFREGHGVDATAADYETYERQMRQQLAEARRNHEEYKLQHDAELQRLNDKINKDTKIFATSYASQVADGRIDDDETLGYISTVVETHEKLAKHFSKDEMAQFQIFETDAAGRTVFSGAKAKDAKQKAVSYKYQTEKVQDNNARYNAATGKYEDIDKPSTYNIYKRQKANAEATKPKGKK